MSLVKLLTRITETGDSAAHAHSITSDPLTQFACAFSALIHDCDHPGVPNSTLVKEGAEIAFLYNGQSVAEQNSFDLAWDLLLNDDYQDLREAIASTEEETRRFRQLLVNSVMATDVIDKQLKTSRDSK